MGYLALDSFAATSLFQLVSERYEKGSIIRMHSGNPILPLAFALC
jgi:hypothetical protein